MARRRRVLVVDDEPDLLQVLRFLLEDQDFEVETVGSGMDCLNSVAAQPPDIIILDIMMPGMGGIEVARRLKGDAGTQSIPIVFLTVLSEKVTRELAAGSIPADYFVSKPFEPEELLEKVREALAAK